MNNGDHTLDFYIKYSPYSSKAIQLPVNPSSIQHGNTTLRDVADLVALGERQIGNGGGLDTISFTSELPTFGRGTHVRMQENEYRGQKFYLDLFKMLDERKSLIDRVLFQDSGVFKFSIIDTINPMNSRTWNCTLESWSTAYGVYELNDIYVTVNMRQHKVYGAQVATIAGIVDGVIRYK